MAGDRRNQRHSERRQPFEHPVAEAHPGMAKILRRHPGPGLDVATGRERLAGAGQDGYADRRIGVDLVAGAGQELQHLDVERIGLVGPVDRQDRDRAFDANGEPRVSHEPLPAMCGAAWPVG